jgi:hypothetical protein
MGQRGSVSTRNDSEDDPYSLKNCDRAVVVMMVLGTFPADMYLGGLIVSPLKVVDFPSRVSQMKTAQIPSWWAT